MTKKKKTETSALGIVVLWTFVLALTFSAGLITGQRLHRKDNLPPLASVRVAPIDVSEPTPALKTKFSFYEKLANPEKPTPKQVTKKHAAPKSTTNKTPGVEKPAEDVKPAPEKMPTQKQLPQDERVEKQVAASPLKEIVSKVKSEVEKIGERNNDEAPAKYTLQVSSHPTKGQADRELLRLKKMGYEVHLISITIPNRGRVFRVRLGKFESMDEARNFQGEIKKKGGVSSFVTPL